MLLGYSWLLVACFVGFQYIREKEYRAGILDEQLQIYNRQILDAIAAGISVDECVKTQTTPFGGLRVTVMSTDGTPIYDNASDTLPQTNHLDRPEIREAIEHGIGHTVSRHSQTTDETYFYSAMAQGDFIVRSAAPYNVSLYRILEADRGFLWFMLIVTMLVSVFGWFSSRHIGKTETLYQESEKTRIKKQLTNNINHELKTPVAAIHVCLETLIDHPNLPESKRNEIIQRCYSNSKRLRTLLQDVSTLTRLEDGKDSIIRERVSVLQAIETAVAENPDADAFDIVIDVHKDIVLEGSPQLMLSVFRNLLSNAITYSQGNKIEILQPDPRTITFADNGVGIPSEHLERIFERFYRVDKGRSRELGGTGLGLSIVKNALAFHSATITATNLSPSGLQFIIRF